MKNRIYQLFLFLFIAAQLYFVVAIIQEKNINSWLLIVFGVLFFILSLAYKKSRILHSKTHSSISYDVFPVFIIGSFATYFLQHDIGFNTVLSAGLVGFSGSFSNKINSRFSKNWPAAIYCGAFVGMTKLELGYSYILSATLFAAAFYTLTQHNFVGIGGKLGTLAFMGVLYSYIIFKIFI